MRIVQHQWDAVHGWQSAESAGHQPQLVFVFGSRTALSNALLLADIGRKWPNARRVGCSTSGEILGTRVQDDSLVCTAVEFASTRVRIAEVAIGEASQSGEAGEALARELNGEGLAHIFVLSDGLKVNGSSLVQGLNRGLPPNVGLTGGLAGDGADFVETLVLLDDEARNGRVVGVGLYGSQIRVGCGSLGGWDPFGVEWEITKSAGNVLHEVDGRNALELYETYLGEHAKDLPASALLFPLSLRRDPSDTPVVRTVLSIDREKGTMTFAGDMPEGMLARFMRANFDRLVEGAEGAARSSLTGQDAELAILISCVGRKLVLKQRIEEEVEGVRDVLGPRPVLAGFYSYGEISPFTADATCSLHNQTMTVTTFREAL